MITEEGVLLPANLERAATVLCQQSAPFQRYVPPNLIRIMPYLRNQDFVARLHTALYPLPVLVEAAGSDGKHLGLVELFDGALGEDDTAGGPRLSFYPLDQHAVKEGSNGFDGLEDGALG